MAADKPTCSRCRAEKPPERKDVYCLLCRRTYAREWEARRRGHAKRRDYQSAYRTANPERRREHAATYRSKNADRLNENYREYYAANAVAIRARWQERYAEDPEPDREKVRRRRARLAAASTVPFTASELIERLSYWGGKCWMCGDDATSVDHVKPLNAGGPHMLANLRPACKPCNSSKKDRWFGVAEIHRFVR